jgi:hypothetical protein
VAEHLPSSQDPEFKSQYCQKKTSIKERRKKNENPVREKNLF